ncbi:hypothetical protein JTB14_000912 [Gonioctena quinquepunctata]|nr:hypothetical protein JTB14_000912 [Gonioctena quinquepunctata]
MKLNGDTQQEFSKTNTALYLQWKESTEEKKTEKEHTGGHSRKHVRYLVNEKTQFKTWSLRADELSVDINDEQLTTSCNSAAAEESSGQDNSVKPTIEYEHNRIPKLEFVKKLDLYYNCLRAVHPTRRCKMGSCKECKAWHDTILHDKFETRTTTSTTNAIAEVNCDCYILKHITNVMPNFLFCTKSWAIPNNITSADPLFYKPGPIDLLIGADILWNILAEALPESKNLSEIEQFCETDFANTTTKDTKGRFVVTIPLKQNSTNMGESRSQAEKRFYTLERKFRKDAQFQKCYKEFMAENRDLLHMTLSDDRNDSCEYSMPHHEAIKEDSLTGKRIQEINSEIADKIKFDFYVDDLLTGASTIKQAYVMGEPISEILSPAGFQLRKWSSNNPDSLEHVISHESKYDILEFTSDIKMKTSGRDSAYTRGEAKSEPKSGKLATPEQEIGEGEQLLAYSIDEISFRVLELDQIEAYYELNRVTFQALKGPADGDNSDSQDPSSESALQ